MKKFIVFIVTAIVLMLTASVSVSAQYVYKIPTAKEMVVQQSDGQLIPFTETTEYKDAKRLRDKGMGESFVGLGVELAGLTIMMLSDNFDDEEVAMLMGGIGVGLGAIVSIVGSCRWIKGETRLRDLRLQYAMSGNGIVITF